ncbi:MAG: 4Fe-4S dicluster domain-containing protein [Vicinamibacteria bacterium]|nr:4Fe-4S dicluster domain-containing protein [Vicinamibacteria bacterium]
MSYDRRKFLKMAGAAGACVAAAPAGAAGTAASLDGPAVLVDTTLCISCRACEAACAEFNQLPAPPETPEGGFPGRRETSTTAFTVVNRGADAGANGEPRYAKQQCLHCLHPACASACPVRALEKTPEGPVVYHADLCMGCRYCMVACPFGIPKYEYEKAIPYVRKCTFCFERQQRGQAPSCTSVCPTGALKFGKRSALLDEARRRVYGEGSRYVAHIYGERESGGTSWLYITDVPFESLGLKAVGETSPTQLTETALNAVPLVMTLWPPLLMGLYAFAHQGRTAHTPQHPEEV